MVEIAVQPFPSPSLELIGLDPAFSRDACLSIAGGTAAEGKFGEA
jgi:hypothetical protein